MTKTEQTKGCNDKRNIFALQLPLQISTMLCYMKLLLFVICYSPDNNFVCENFVVVKYEKWKIRIWLHDYV